MPNTLIVDPERPGWLVRVLNVGGRTQGGGILVDDEHILTCAHVVMDAIYPETNPFDHHLQIDFPALAADPVQATVLREGWSNPGAGDTAVLALAGAPPSGAAWAPLRNLTTVDGHPFRVPGFPNQKGLPDGSVVVARGTASVAAGVRFSLTSLREEQEPQMQIERGFSGCPVWDDEDDVRGVIGIVKATYRAPGAGVAYLIPVSELAKQWPRVGGPQLALLQHLDYVIGVSISQDGLVVATADVDQCVHAWDVATNQEMQQCKMRCGSQVWAVTFDPNGEEKRLAAGTDDGALVWDLNRVRPPLRLKHEREVRSLMFTGDGDRLVTGCDDGIARLWDSRTGEELQGFSLGGKVLTVAVSSRGTRIAAGGDTGYVRIWDVESGQQFEPLTGFHGVVWQVKFHPLDDNMLATASANGSVRTWDVKTGIDDKRIEHGAAVMGLAYSPNGALMATGGVDGTVHLWDTGTEIEVGRYLHNRGIRALAFSSDGLRLASCSIDRSARVWAVGPK